MTQTTTCMLKKRIPEELMEPEIAREITLRSGGVVRELVRIARECCSQCLLLVRSEPNRTDIKINEEILESAIRDLRDEFTFPIVLWVSESILVSLARRAPDFWSWRGGVFWFKHDSIETPRNTKKLNIPVSNQSKSTSSLPLKEIILLIERMETQDKEAPLLSTLYNSLASAYRQHNSSYQDSELAIQAYEKAISLQKN